MVETFPDTEGRVISPTWPEIVADHALAA